MRLLCSLFCAFALVCLTSSCSRNEAPTPPAADRDAEAPVEAATVPPTSDLQTLPKDGGPEFNRLVFEKSPYLLQHKRNPVDWFPWGDEAFARAKELDRPIFLSIGYSTCHWCHVMEHESFEDEDVAQLLNAHFICIKVDREERPDLDHQYMAVTQALTQRGGWPMTVVLTPEGKPWFAGTYFPKDYLIRVLTSLNTAWGEQREDIEASGQHIVEQLAGRQRSSNATREDINTDWLRNAAAIASSQFDPVNGGFGGAPKFPTPHLLLAMLHASQARGDEAMLAMVTQTLTAMRMGGIYDHVGYGFHRYATDAEWRVPHFEKMLYDQALHLIAYTRAYQVTGDALFAQTAREIATYVLRDMTSPLGGFYSAEDADSMGEEGLFYMWRQNEVRAVLGAERARVFEKTYHIEAEGNYHDEATRAMTGRNIPYLTPENRAALIDEDLAQMRKDLFEHREERIRPLRDDKVLTDWNGLMIAAMSIAGTALQEPTYVEAAKGAARFVDEALRGEDGRLVKRYRDGESGLPAHLDDYAFLLYGLLELHDATQDHALLTRSVELADHLLKHFDDKRFGGFFMTAETVNTPIFRAKESYDGAIPAGNSVAALSLTRLSRLTGDARYATRAHAAVAVHGARVVGSPTGHAMLLLAADYIATGGLEIVVATDGHESTGTAMLDVVRSRFVPNRVLLHKRARDAKLLDDLAPYARAMVARDGAATAYVCRRYSCELPTTDTAKMLELIDVALAPQP